MECNVAWMEVAEPTTVGKTVTELGNVGDTITCMVTHPTNDLLFVGTASGKVVVWDPTQAAMMCSFQAHNKDLTRITFDSSGRIFLTASVDGFVHWWDQQFTRGQGVSAGCPLFAVCFSPKGDQVAAGGEDGILRVWNAQTGVLLESFSGHTDSITACSWVDKALVSAGAQGYMRSWDVGQRRCFRTHKGHEGHISQLIKSHHGKSYLSSSWDKTIKVWNLQHREKFAFPQGNQPVTSISLSSDDKRLASGYWDGTVRLWNVDSAKIIDEFEAHESGLIGCVFLPHAKVLVTASQDGMLRGWKIEEMGTNRYVNQHGGEVYAVHYTAENVQAISGGYDGFLKLWDRNERMETGAIELEQPILSCAVSPDNRYWAAGTAEGEIKLWNYEEQAFEADLLGHKGPVTGLRFLPGGDRLVSCSWDTKIHLWLVDARQIECKFDGHSREVAGCDVSLDSRKLLTASWDGSARLWDLTERKQRGVGTELMELDGHTERVLCCAFSPDGTRVVTGSADETVRLWYTDSAEEPQLLIGHTDGVSSCRFTPDGRLLLTADRSGNVILWDPYEERVVGNIQHGSPILSLSISPDGTQAMIGDERGQIRFLNLEYPRGPVWIATVCYLKAPPLWRRGGPPAEVYEAICLYCGSGETIQKKQLGKLWKCEKCNAEFMLCPRSLPPIATE